MGAVKGFKKMFGGAIGWVKGKYEKGKQWATGKATAAKEWGAGKVRGIKDRLTGGEEEKDEGGDAAPDGEREDGHFVATVVMQGHKHTVEADLDGTVSMASRKGSLAEKVQAQLDIVNARTHPTPREGAALENILEIIATLKKAGARSHPDKPTVAYTDACRALVEAISDYGQRFDAQDIDPVDVAPPTDLTQLVGAADHVPPALYSGAKHAKGTTDDMRKENSEENGQFLAGLSDADIIALERETLLTGELVPRAGGSFHAYKKYAQQIGWDKGKPAHVHRAELIAGSIHSHPRLNR